MNLIVFHHGGYMQLFLKKSVTVVFSLIALSYAVSVYSEGHASSPVVSSANNSLVSATPVKQENISIDYAHAHSELMKKPDEVVVQAF
jgi:ABC-type enterochelin transport system substrate-binding protein